MSVYELLVFVHVFAAATWFGAAMHSLVSFVIRYTANDREGILRGFAFDEKLAPVLYIPASMLTLLVGIALAIDGNWSWSEQLWIPISVAAWFTTFLIGILIMKPAGERLKARIDEHGIDTEPVGSFLTGILKVGLFDLLVLTFVVFLMTTKPF